MSNQSDAIQEAQASGDTHGIELVVASFDHPSFPDPVHTVMGSEDDLELPLVEGEAPVLCKAVAFTAIPPGQGKTGPIDGSLRVDGANVVLIEPLRLAAGQNKPVSVTLRTYIVAPYPDYETPTGPDEVFTGLIMTNVQMDESGASGTLTYPDERDQGFPLATYEPDEYPGLVGV